MSDDHNIPEDLLVELGFLNEQTSQIRGATPLDDPRRLVVEQFCQMVMDTVDTYGVSIYRLSLLLGLSDANLRLKMGRHGYLPLPPSQRAYSGTRVTNAGNKTPVCKRGHDTSKEGSRYAGGHCKECSKLRDQARKARAAA